jgi:hypothetical protein
MARKDRINKKPLHNSPLPPFIKGGWGGLLIYDVNITTEKVNEKNPLEALLSKSFSARVFLDKKAFFIYEEIGQRGCFLIIHR